MSHQKNELSNGVYREVLDNNKGAEIVLYFEKIWWEPLFSELDNAHLLECNLEVRGEG